MRRYDASGWRNKSFPPELYLNIVFRYENISVLSETPLKGRCLLLIEPKLCIHTHFICFVHGKGSLSVQKLWSKIPLSLYLALPRIFNIYSEIIWYKLEKTYFFAYRKEEVFHKFSFTERSSKQAFLRFGAEGRVILFYSFITISVQLINDGHSLLLPMNYYFCPQEWI